ncbi:MAG: VacB/RNase II family 3'-5' exoribonuclease [Candidatus Brocadiia bacterium]
MPDPAMKQRILDLMSKPGYRGLKQRQVALLLRIEDDRYEEFKLALRQLVSEGSVAKNRGNKYDLALRSKKIIGKLTVRGTNYGYVSRGPLGIVEIRRGGFGGALHGDMVEVEITIPPFGGRLPEGRVVNIISVGERLAVGSVIESRSGMTFIPIRGGVWPEADILSASVTDLAHGDLVTVEFVRDSYGQFGASVVERLGSGAEYSSTLEAILRAYEIASDFPSDVVEEASLANEAPLSIEGRTDFRSLTAITIDPEDAKDFDDALSLEELPDGWRLYVHIADVSSAVPPASALDVEARRRGTSVYLPGFVVPMLPHQLSNHRCCLSPNEDRLAKTAIMEFNADGTRRSSKLLRSVIHSAMRLDYGIVQRKLKGEIETVGVSEVDSLLEKLWALASKMRRLREDSGSLNLDMPEVVLRIDDNGVSTDLTREWGNESHFLVEECMLAANCAVAEIISDMGIPGIYRIHDEPDPLATANLRNLLVSFGLPVSQQLRRTDLADIVEKVKDEAYARVVNLAILRSMKMAVYRDTPGLHYALAFDRYLHFTSPIRRYPDLYVHQQLDARYFHCRAGVQEQEALADIALLCCDTERNADECERNMVQLKTLEYLSRYKGQEFAGVITAVKEFGVIVELVDFLVDGLIHVRELGNEYYLLNGDGVRLQGDFGSEYRPGQSVVVRLHDVDLPRRRLELRFVGIAARTGYQRKGASHKPGKKSPKAVKGKSAGRKQGKGRRPR